MAAGKSPRLSLETPHIVVDTRLPPDGIIAHALEQLARRGISAPPGRDDLGAPGSA